MLLHYVIKNAKMLTVYLFWHATKMKVYSGFSFMCYVSNYVFFPESFKGCRNSWKLDQFCGGMQYWKHNYSRSSGICEDYN